MPQASNLRGLYARENLEVSFSKLKLMKTYLQEIIWDKKSWVHDLAILSTEQSTFTEQMARKMELK